MSNNLRYSKGAYSNSAQGGKKVNTIYEPLVNNYEACKVCGNYAWLTEKFCGHEITKISNELGMTPLGLMDATRVTMEFPDDDPTLKTATGVMIHEANKRALHPINDADIIATSDESYNLGRKHGIQEALALIPSARYEALEEARLATCWLCADGESVIQHSDSGEYYHPSRSHEFGLSEKRRALDTHSCFANRIRQIQAQDENRETQ